MELKKLIFRTKPEEGKKRSTIAGIVVGNKIQVGLSTCSLKDQFVKSKGREIALGRAFERPEQVIELTETDNPIKKFVEFSKQYITDFNL